MSRLHTDDAVLTLTFRTCPLLSGYGSGLLGLSLREAKGLSSRILSASHNRVVCVSSLMRCSFSRASKIFRTDLILRSHIPPWWLAAVELKYHWTSSFLNRSQTCSSQLSFRASKVGAIIAVYCLGLSSLTEKTLIRADEESASSVCAISMYTALMVRHVNKQLYRFTSLFPCFTNRGPQ